MNVTDTLILEDRMSQTLKAVQVALDHASASARISQVNMEQMRKTYGDTSIEAAKATLEWSRNAKQVENLQNKLEKLNTEQQKVNDSLQEAATSSNKMTGIYAGIGSAVGNIAANLAIQLGQGLKSAVGEAINTASDLVEVQNVVDVAFGNSAKEINDWSRTALTQFGLNELSAKQFTGTMGAMLKSSGLTGDAVTQMSMSIAGLAGDMASFYNLDPSEAFMKLRSGISGETEPLKQLGINMSVANLEAFALSQGITKAYNSMSQAEQMTLRYNYLMQATADAQGDFARTSNTFANQQRILNENWKRLTAALATGVLPVLTQLLSFGNRLINSAMEVIAKIQELTQNAQFMEGLFENLIIVIGALTPLFGYLAVQAAIAGANMIKTGVAAAWAGRQALLAGLKAAGAWLLANAPIILAIAAVGALILVFVKFNKVVEQVLNFCIDKFFDFVETCLSGIRLIAEAIDKVFKSNLTEGVDKLSKMAETARGAAKKGTHEMQKWLENVGKTDYVANLTAKVNQQTGANKTDNPLAKAMSGNAIKTKQQGAIELKEEDVKMLNELATRDFMIRYQTLSPSVNFGNVTVNENADFGQLVDMFATGVTEAANNNLNSGTGK